MEKRGIRSIVMMAALVGLALGLPPVAASGEAFLFEVRELTAGNPPFSRNVYACFLCTPELFAPVVPPPGFEKAPGKLLLPSFAVAELPAPPAGVAPGLDLVPEIPGDDFTFIARLLTAQLVGLAPPPFAVFVVAQVERDTLFRYDAGEVVHQVTDTSGNTFLLFSFALALLDSFDLGELGALASLPFPPGWTYSSRELASELWVASDGLATVFAQGQLASWQRLSGALSVGVEIMPGTEEAPVNPTRRGVIPVAVLGSDAFDVADVDVTTLAFGPEGASLAHRNGPHVKDANHDGIADLLAHFRAEEAGLLAGDEVACVSGETLDGAPFRGCDELRTVPE